MSLSAKLAQRYRALANAGIRNRAMEQLEHNLKIFRQEVGKPLSGEISYNRRTAKGNLIMDKRTGQPKKSYISLGMPKGLTEEQQVVYESIVTDFLEDPTSSRKNINKEFRNVQKMREAAKRSYYEDKIGKMQNDPKLAEEAVDKLMSKWKKQNAARISNFTQQQMAEDVDIYNRMQKEVAIKEVIYEQYQNMWTMAKVKGFDYKDMLEALYAVTVTGTEGVVGVSELLDSDKSLLDAGDGFLLSNRNISLVTGENSDLENITPPKEWMETAQLEEEVTKFLYEKMEVNR